MGLRPSADEIIRGLQRTLSEQVLPEVQTQYAAAQVSFAIYLLHTLRGEWDGAAQRLVEDNAELRAWAMRAADVVEAHDTNLSGELRRAAAVVDPDVRIRTLSGANDELRALQARVLALCGAVPVEPLAVLAEDSRGVLRDSVKRRSAGALMLR